MGFLEGPERRHMGHLPLHQQGPLRLLQGVRAGRGPTLMEQQPEVGVGSVTDGDLHVDGILEHLHHRVVTSTVVGAVVFVYKGQRRVAAVKTDLGTSVFAGDRLLATEPSPASVSLLRKGLRAQKSGRTPTAGQRLQRGGSHLWQSGVPA